mgnify:CR=1 FL=1
MSLYLLCFISILSRSHTIFLFKSSLKVGLTGIAKIIAYFGQTFFRKSKETFCLFQLTPHNEAADIEAELFFELVCQIRAPGLNPNSDLNFLAMKEVLRSI